jgi:phospholipase C
VEVPEVALWPRNLLRYHDHLHSLEDFFEDAAHGRLRPVNIVTPDVLAVTEGECMNDQVGESFPAAVFDGVASGPHWPGTMFILVWDEGGGFYDHVPPPSAEPPDEVAPDITVPPDEPGGYDRYGFRVPSWWRRRTRGPAMCPPWCMTTLRSWRPWRGSGTCPR